MDSEMSDADNVYNELLSVINEFENCPLGLGGELDNNPISNEESDDAPTLNNVPPPSLLQNQIIPRLDNLVPIAMQNLLIPRLDSLVPVAMQNQAIPKLYNLVLLVIPCPMRHQLCNPLAVPALNLVPVAMQNQIIPKLYNLALLVILCPMRHQLCNPLAVPAPNLKLLDTFTTYHP